MPVTVEISKDNYTRNYDSFRVFIGKTDLSRFQTDSIYCRGGVKEQVMRLIDGDSENPFKDAVFESHYENPEGIARRSTRTITADTYEKAYEEFCNLKMKFMQWANTKYKEYGVDLYDKSELMLNVKPSQHSIFTKLSDSKSVPATGVPFADALSKTATKSAKN